jgi:hypothetical protein
MQNAQKKRMMIVAGVIALFVIAAIGVAAFVVTRKKEAPAEAAPVEEKRKKKTDQINTIPVTERPFIELKPTGTGKNILLSINELKKPAESVEYELEYQAGELLQGAFGTLELGSLPATKDILFGSCSAGGACTYHQNVQGGTLVTRFSGTNSYALKSDWRYIENRAREKAISSKDAKFQIESAEIGKQGVLVVFNTPGFPDTPPGTVISEVYSLTTGGTLKGSAKVSIRANEEAEGAKIAVWNGSSWKTVDATAEGKQFSATVDLGSVYTVVKE